MPRGVKSAVKPARKRRERVTPLVGPKKGRTREVGPRKAKSQAKRAGRKLGGGLGSTVSAMRKRREQLDKIK